MSARGTLRGALELALWTLLFGLDRLSVGVEHFRHGHPRLGHGPKENRLQESVRLVPTQRIPPRAPPTAAPPAPPPVTVQLVLPPRAFETQIPLVETTEEKRKMSVDQDLSGDMVKVVQYCIVAAATGILNNAAVLSEMQTVAFSDDMTAADFSTWRLSEFVPGPCPCPWPIEVLHKKDSDYTKSLGLSTAEETARSSLVGLFKKINSTPPGERIRLIHQIKSLNPGISDGDIEAILKNKKWWRVAFNVVSRFSPADIDWEIAQVEASGQQAAQLADIAETLRNWPKPKKGD